MRGPRVFLVGYFQWNSQKLIILQRQPFQIALVGEAFKAIENVSAPLEIKTTWLRKVVLDKKCIFSSALALARRPLPRLRLGRPLGLGQGLRKAFSRRIFLWLAFSFQRHRTYILCNLKNCVGMETEGKVKVFLNSFFAVFHIFNQESYIIVRPTTSGPFFMIKKYFSLIKIFETIPVIRLCDGT